ncbi:MAG: polyhydroxyalkanoic acid system family protein [Myxococcales bacterium]|nr:polyhydroxyalkanoic acid system family protein [Myxococcales bacterium]
MADISISRNHALGKDVARQKAESLATKLQDKLGIEWSWKADAIHFEAKGGVAKGAKGTVAVTDSTIKVEVGLTFALKLMKGTIESKINDKLDEALRS